MQLFDERTTKRHSKLAGLASILLASIFLEVSIETIPIIGVTDVDSDKVLLIISGLIIVWFFLWFQLFIFDRKKNYSREVFNNLTYYLKIEVEETEAFKKLFNDDASLSFYIHARDNTGSLFDWIE
ncbi:MAG: hypothetical protein HRU29_08765 [Rhizobiales bacterium]|nr:hypothetical protein [Hyphomicrobiales bacterium]NRB14479.1 hypothetical protein [Hyphomicrobiales bacterium]